MPNTKVGLCIPSEVGSGSQIIHVAIFPMLGSLNSGRWRTTRVHDIVPRHARFCQIHPSDWVLQVCFLNINTGAWRLRWLWRCGGYVQWISVNKFLINWLAPGGICMEFKISKFQANFLWLMAEVSLGKLPSGNGLVPSGNKSLPEPLLTQFCVTIWCH